MCVSKSEGGHVDSDSDGGESVGAILVYCLILVLATICELQIITSLGETALYKPHLFNHTFTNSPLA